MSFLCSCSFQSESNNESEQIGQIFRTGCYPLDTSSVGIGLYDQTDGLFYPLDTSAVIDVRDFKEVSVSKSTGKYLVNLVLTDEGAQKFTAATEKYLGNYLAFVVDNKLVMIPRIREKITGNSVLIDGNFTEDQMIDCYRQIKASMAKH